jgi:hypothetical protein
MTDATINNAVKRFRAAMAVIDETLPVLQAAHLDEVPEIKRMIEALMEVRELEARLRARREELRGLLTQCGVDINDYPGAIGAQVRRMIGW